MKLLILALSMVLCFCSTLLAQDLKGKWELSVSGGFQLIKYKADNYHILNIPLRVGHCFTSSIEVDLEGIVSVQEEIFSNDTETGFMVGANGSYNIPSSSSVRPFLLLGVGYADGLPLTYGLMLPTEEGLYFIVANAGVGIKAFAGERVAFRTEYRFQSFNGQGEAYGASDADYAYHSLLFGVSLFVH